MAKLHRVSSLALGVAAAALLLSACGTSTGAGGTLIVGTTDKVTALDPAGSYDNGSYHVETQVFQFLYGFKPNEVLPQPDIAEKCEYTSDTVLECTLKSGLKFSNGHALTASDVKFSFDRQVAINDPSGPASLLSNLNEVVVVNDTTVQFKLDKGPDQTFIQVLATPVGPIVDEEVFSATALTPDDDIVKADAFSGPYHITSYKVNDTIVFAANSGYNGVQGKPANAGVTLKTFSESTNLKLAIENGEVDVAFRSLTPTDITSLKTNSNVTVHEGPGGEIRYIVFNLDTMPGDTPAQKFAIRQAIASLVDREELSTEVYKSIYTPLCSWVPDGQSGANTAACDAYPMSKDAAAKFLADAGVATPVTLDLQYNPDHYGSSSDQEYARVKAQLEASGLFTIKLAATEWVSYSKDRVADAYPAYQLGWFPDYPDADNYLQPFFDVDNFLHNHFDEPAVQALIAEERTQPDPALRAKKIEEIQTVMAEKYLSTVPLLQGIQVAVTRAGVSGVVLDASFQFRYVTLVPATAA